MSDVTAKLYSAQLYFRILQETVFLLRYRTRHGHPAGIATLNRCVLRKKKKRQDDALPAFAGIVN